VLLKKRERRGGGVRKSKEREEGAEMKGAIDSIFF
jgi:hypothetical protein